MHSMNEVGIRPTIQNISALSVVGLVRSLKKSEVLKSVVCHVGYHIDCTFFVRDFVVGLIFCCRRKLSL